MPPIAPDSFLAHEIYVTGVQLDAQPATNWRGAMIPLVQEILWSTQTNTDDNATLTIFSTSLGVTMPPNASVLDTSRIMIVVSFCIQAFELGYTYKRTTHV
jgi:hypothetical protein